MGMTEGDLRVSPTAPTFPVGGGCYEVKVGSFRYLVRRARSPPSACGISPRGAGESGNGDYAQVSSGGAVGSDCTRVVGGAVTE